MAMNTMKSVAACALAVLAFGTFSTNLLAQQLYRIVGADGKIHLF
jgi:hypothetical protein